MGYNEGRWTVTYRTSAHNSERDVRDEALAEEMIAELEAVINQEKYRVIDPWAF